MRELLLDQIVDQRTDRGMVETIDDFVQEAGDEELLRNRHRDAAREEVKHFVLAELA